VSKMWTGAVSIAVALAIAAAPMGATTPAHADSIGDTGGTVDLLTEGKTMDRVAGDDRYETMSKILDQSFKKSPAGEIAVVASGRTFADVLSGTALAGALKGPIIITDTEELTASAKESLLKTGAKQVLILGDENAINDEVASEIATLVGGSVDRLCGINRYETSDSIFRYRSGSLWGKTAIIATGVKPADSLSIASLSYAESAPVLLANADGNLTESEKKDLENGGFERILICGDDVSVSTETESYLKNLPSSPEIKRFDGADRYETNSMICDYLVSDWNFTYNNLCVTAGRDGKWPDALCASPFLAENRSVLVIAEEPRGCITIDKNMTNYSNASTISRIYILGDETSVSALVAQRAYSAICAQQDPEPDPDPDPPYWPVDGNEAPIFANDGRWISDPSNFPGECTWKSNYDGTWTNEFGETIEFLSVYSNVGQCYGRYNDAGDLLGVVNPYGQFISMEYMSALDTGANCDHNFPNNTRSGNWAGEEYHGDLGSAAAISWQGSWAFREEEMYRYGPDTTWYPIDNRIGWRMYGNFA
ncbi:MAG: cell wall-binding repeat-containing protein, partial [Raoultibacter sp.]